MASRLGILPVQALMHLLRCLEPRAWHIRVGSAHPQKISTNFQRGKYAGLRVRTDHIAESFSSTSSISCSRFFFWPFVKKRRRSFGLLQLARIHGLQLEDRPPGPGLVLIIVYSGTRCGCCELLLEEVGPEPVGSSAP